MHEVALALLAIAGLSYLSFDLLPRLLVSRRSEPPACDPSCPSCR